MVSIHTNRSALQALQTLNATQQTLATAQNRVATGLKVSGAKDDSAVFAIAQNLKAQNRGWTAATQSLARASSVLHVTDAALTGINDLLVSVKKLAVAYADPSLTASSRLAIRADIESHFRQIESQAKTATFDGVNLLDGLGMQATVRSSASYTLPTSTKTPMSFLTPMSAGANTTVSASMTSQLNLSLPRSPLTPDSLTQIVGLNQTAVNASVFMNRSVYSGDARITVNHDYGAIKTAFDNAGRVDIWVDAFVEGNAFEVWQGGKRVASSGQAYVAGASAIGAGSTVTGQVMLSFDYDPAVGKSYEIRATGGNAWAFERGYESGPGSPPSSPPNAHSVVVSARSDASSLPPVDLRPETAGASPASQGVLSRQVNGGTQAGRIDLLFDAFENPDVVEIYQNGVRVAASGQDYVAGGGMVGPGLARSGQQLLSFDYDPANGQTLEFRFNENNPHDGAGWVVGGAELYPAGTPRSAAHFPTQTTQSVTTFTTRETFASVGANPRLLTPETEAAESASKTYRIDAGEKSGRVDMLVDAYGGADVVEIWQNGVRVAASGQAYARNGEAVPAGLERSGNFTLSFDYDPARGRDLEFRFNPDTPDKIGAWTVGGLVLQDGTAPLPTVYGPSVMNWAGQVQPDIGFISTPELETLRISTRNMTAAGLGLAGVNWNEPDDLMLKVEAALTLAVSAASYFGVQQANIDRLLNHAVKHQDALEMGLGNLVDADMAKESAKLQAAQIRQQLAVQTLSIANNQPQWLLNLFKS